MRLVSQAERQQGESILTKEDGTRMSRDSEKHECTQKVRMYKEFRDSDFITGWTGSLLPLLFAYAVYRIALE